MTRVLNRGNRGLIEATLDTIPLSARSRLLDVGFGGGLLLELAHARGVRRLAGVDPSADAVAALRARAARLRGADLRLDTGTVQALPFPDATFDAVVSTNTVYFWPELALAFRELHRVLAGGGTLSIGFSSAEKLREFGAITRHGFNFHETASLAAAAAEAGFADVRIVNLRGRAIDGDHVLVATKK
jgi:SAM-dependent methyltransferase